MHRKWLAKINVSAPYLKPKWVKIGAEKQTDGTYLMVASNNDEMSNETFFSLMGVVNAIDHNWSFRVWQTTFFPTWFNALTGIGDK